ncbi:MAG TPA: carboxypeptidase regulatory-like domain-containing protein, partial [Chitinophagaceae bacterium]|nr:carboxypeptidase regulatory-like domain-containing protein [Chitinophagaceae bacterium]
IKGKVSPADGVSNVMAVSGADTVKADVSMGAFEISHLKPGTYTVIIDAADPYKDAMKDGVQVTDGIATDVGEIQLQK